MAQAATDVREMFDRIAGRYDATNRVMSAGLDVLWRRRAMRLLLGGLEQSPWVLDLGAGTLDGAVEILRQRPDAQVVAADFTRAMLLAGRRKRGAAKVVLHTADGHRLPYRDGSFAASFSGFCVRNLRDLASGLAELRRVVRPGGRLVVLEFFHSARPRPFWDGIFTGRLLPLLGWAISGDRAAYRYLPESIQRFDMRADFEARLRTAGFTDVRSHDLFPGGIASLVEAR
ncbi:MAG: ubiquinone/menaquinone biosynthesis methyltransferase [Polyangia bacterium]|jgi:ubiquinone/menaquinone biosynthesis methyltransferase